MITNFVRRKVTWWLDQWVYFYPDLISAYIGVFWALNLLPGPTPTAGPHIQMAQIMDLRLWGVVAVGLWVSTVIALHFPRIGWRRTHNFAFQGGFWLFVAILFMSSGSSLTGWGNYLVHAFAAIVLAFRLPDALNNGVRQRG